MRPGIVPLTIYKGATFDEKVLLQDPTGAPLPLLDLYDGARADIRNVLTSALMLRMSTDDGSIVLGNDGTIQFNVSAAVTAGISSNCQFEDWGYDLELYKTTAGVEHVDRALQGAVIVSPEVTRNVV